MDLSFLFRRDLARLVRQVEAFPNTATLWRRAPGMANSAGNLVLHIEGNLREYVGRQLGNVPYSREREFEFAAAGFSQEDLVSRVEELRRLVPLTLQTLSEQRMKMAYPEDVLGRQISVGAFLIHLYGHLNWHLGQIDSLRRVFTGTEPSRPSGSSPLSLKVGFAVRKPTPHLA